MKMVSALLLVLSSQAFAQDLNLSCVVKNNLQPVIQSDITLGQKEVKLGDIEAFTYLVSAKGNGKVEIQAYNVAETSRSYATAVLKNSGDFVEVSLWSRSYLIEARCTLK